MMQRIVRTGSVVALLVVFVAVMATSAHADLVFVSSADDLPNTQDAENTYINNLVGPQTYLAKINQGGESEDGAISVTYFTATFDANCSPDCTTADLSWNLTGSGYQLNYVLVVDGGGNAKLYSLYATTSDQKIVGGDTVECCGDLTRGISHVTFYGSAAGVPEPSLLVLLGTGLAGALVLARRLT